MSLNEHKLRIFSRNEGKLKSYASCYDVRAWSHDQHKRDSYLKDWIKADMPLCIIPACVLANLMRIMTKKGNAKVTPKCHPNCKSKILLDDIHSSCQAIRVCLQKEKLFEKYFREEEFETSHWPCDKCLEILKSIKMFWKIIAEKVFHLNLTKTAELKSCNTCNRAESSVKSIAHIWQKEIVQQVYIVQKYAPFPKNNISPWNTNDIPLNVPNQLVINKISSNSLYRHKTIKRPSQTGKSDIGTQTKRKITRGVGTKTETQSAICCTSDLYNEELNAYKNKFQYLQQQYNYQREYIEKLQAENTSLKLKLNHFYKDKCMKNTIINPSGSNIFKDGVAFLPHPFEKFSDHNIGNKSYDSEMIITMKNCTHENYKHVSVLQVLHKTNNPACDDLRPNSSNSSRRDPIEILAKVKNTFGEIVCREIKIAEKSRYSKKPDIEAIFHKVYNSKSAPSCSTMGSNSVTDLISTLDPNVKDKSESKSFFL